MVAACTGKEVIRVSFRILKPIFNNGIIIQKPIECEAFV